MEIFEKRHNSLLDTNLECFTQISTNFSTFQEV